MSCDGNHPMPECGDRTCWHKAEPITAEDTKPGKVIARDQVLKKTLDAAPDEAIKGMVGRLFGAALEDFAEATTLAFTVALRELAEENMPRLTKRVLELVETQLKGRA